MSEEFSAKRDKYIAELTGAYAETYNRYLERIPQATKDRIQRKAHYMKNGLSTYSCLTCLGPEKCPFFHACPIPENHSNPGRIEEYPVNDPCVLEVEYIAQQVITYMEKLNVDPGDPIEMSLINELALNDLLKNRAVLILSGGDAKGGGRDLLSLEEVITGWEDDGTARVTQNVRVHPAMDILDRLERRRTKVLDMMAATREKKIKFGGISSNSNLMRDLATIKHFIESVQARGALVDGEAEEGITFGEISEKTEESAIFLS